MTPNQCMDLTLTGLFLLTGVLLYKLYRQDFDILHLWASIFLFVDSLGFTAFDFSDYGINKEIYDMVQMSLVYFVLLCILFIVVSRILGKKMMNKVEGNHDPERRKKSRRLLWTNLIWF